MGSIQGSDRNQQCFADVVVYLLVGAGKAKLQQQGANARIPLYFCNSLDCLPSFKTRTVDENVREGELKRKKSRKRG